MGPGDATVRSVSRLAALVRVLHASAMLELLALAALSIAAFFVVRRVFRGKAKPIAAKQEAPVEIWARSEIARILADKLELEESQLSATLRGNPDPDLVTRLERSVRKMEIVYERVPGMDTAADVRVEVQLENGKLERSIRRVEKTELPAHVMEDWAKTGASQVFRPFLFPWQS